MVPASGHAPCPRASSCTYLGGWGYGQGEAGELKVSPAAVKTRPRALLRTGGLPRGILDGGRGWVKRPRPGQPRGARPGAAGSEGPWVWHMPVQGSEAGQADRGPPSRSVVNQHRLTPDPPPAHTGEGAGNGGPQEASRFPRASADPQPHGYQERTDLQASCYCSCRRPLLGGISGLLLGPCAPLPSSWLLLLYF